MRIELIEKEIDCAAVQVGRGGLGVNATFNDDSRVTVHGEGEVSRGVVCISVQRE